MGTCKGCGASISGRGRQRCESCSAERKRETNKAFWVRVAEARPILACKRCGAEYTKRPGQPSLREYCQACALEIRRVNRQNDDRKRNQERGNRHNPVQARVYARKYKRTHVEWNRRQSSLYTRRHPDKVRQWTNQRRATLAKAEGHVTITEFWQLCEESGWLCHYCHGALTRATATMDHVIPLSKGGTNLLSNIVLACRACNASKGNRIGNGIHEGEAIT